jgi:hypothetical protein
MKQYRMKFMLLMAERPLTYAMSGTATGLRVMCSQSLYLFSAARSSQQNENFNSLLIWVCAFIHMSNNI